MRGVLLTVFLSAAAYASDADAGVIDVPTRDIPAADAGILTPAVIEVREVDEGPTFFDTYFSGTRLLRGFYFEIAFLYGAGGLVHTPGAAPIPMTGLRLSERHGFFSWVLAKILGDAMIAYSAVEISNVSTSVSDRYVGNGVIERTTTTSYTARRVMSDQQVLAAQGDLSKSLTGSTWLDIVAYDDKFLGIERGVPGAAGWEFAFGVDFELFQWNGLPAVLDVGLYFANVRAARPLGASISGSKLEYPAGGVVARFHLPLTRFFTLTAEQVLNVLSFGYLIDADTEQVGRVPSSPLRLGLQLHLTDRVFVKAQGVLGGFGFVDGKLGFLVDMGVRL